MTGSFSVHPISSRAATRLQPTPPAFRAWYLTPQSAVAAINIIGVVGQWYAIKNCANGRVVAVAECQP